MTDLMQWLRAKYTVTDEFSTIRRPVNPDGHEAAARIEALEAENDSLKAIVQGWHWLAVGPDEMGDYYTQKHLIKASEPYASPALKEIGGD